MPSTDSGDTRTTQVFATPGRERSRSFRIGIAVIALLVSAWLAALAFGVFGGFDSLPGLALGDKDDSEASAPPAEDSEPVADEPTAVPETGQPVAQPQGEQAGEKPAGGDGTAGQKPATAPAVAPAPQPQPTANTNAHPGKPAGAGSTDGTGKPVGTPGNGSVNAGGASTNIPNGKAVGQQP